MMNGGARTLMVASGSTSSSLIGDRVQVEDGGQLPSLGDDKKEREEGK